ncbi:MAG: ABC transporter permease [Gemmatimonadaceae bacterium]
MNPIRWIVLRMRSVLGRSQVEDDMQEEMRAHLARATARLIARGLSPEDARLAARREFGNATMIEDDAREARGARWVEALRADVRFAFRHFRRHKRTTATLLAVLALGIGANTVIFSAIQAYLTRPAPGFQETDSHVRLYGVEQTARSAPWRLREFSLAELVELRSRRDAFAAVAGWMEHDVVLNATETREARGMNAQFVTANFFQALGVSFVAGTGFSGTDETADLAAVITSAAAKDYFETPEKALGRRLVVNDIAVRVVGVAPPGFRGATRAEPRPDLWLPVSARAEIARRAPRWLHEPSLLAFARLAPGVTHEQAGVIASSAAARLMPDSSARTGAPRNTEVLAIRSRPPAYVSDGPARFFVIAAVSTVGILILLVACTNVSSLLVASAVTRRHEVAVRLSMGASRTRLLRQMLTESALISVAGGLLGLLLYWWVMLATGGGEGELGVNLTPDFGTLLFTMAFSLGTGLVFGLSPALHATHDDVAKALRDSGTGASHRSRLQSGFVVAQLVCSQPLLLILAMAMASIYDDGAIRSVASDRVILAQFRPLTSTGGPGQRQQAVDSVGQRIARHPGVERVVPDAQRFAAAVVTGNNPAQPHRVRLDGVMPGYFGMHDMPIILGRDVTLPDTLDPTYNLVLGSDLARDLWGDANPIGRTLPSVRWPQGARDSAAMRVVGVFDASGGDKDDPVAYTAGGKHWSRESLLIRTRDVGDRTIPELRALIRADAPSLPLTGIQTLAFLQESERAEVLGALQDVGAAGLVALLLAMLGLHGVVALSVTQRTREIGIRIAMGARPLRVALMFVASGVRLTAVGLAIGLPLGLIGIKILLANESDPPRVSLGMIGVGISTLMVLVAAAAAWMPARRAAAVDPALTLRAE